MDVRVAASDGEAVLFTVADAGPGIRPEDRPRLFDRFWQAADSQAGGAGLGLAVVKGIVEGHGGRIWVAEHDGPGATFHFTIPASIAADRVDTDAAPGYDS